MEKSNLCSNTASSEVNCKVEYLSMENELLRKIVAEMEEKNDILKAHNKLLNENLNFHIKKHCDDPSTSPLSGQTSSGCQKPPVVLQDPQFTAKQVEEAVRNAELSTEDGVQKPKYERQQTTGGKIVSTQTDAYDTHNQTMLTLPKSVRQSIEQIKAIKTMGDSPFGSRSSFNWDKDFEKYDKYYRFKSKRDKEYKVVKEIQQDLFLMGVEYALAVSVAEDLNMGSGIAVSFRQKFKKIDELMKQNQRQGGLALLHIDNGRYIYYLVTKQKSSGRATLNTMFRSVKKLRDHMVEHKVGKLAIPRLGCGYDRFEWTEVKNMFEFLFENTDIEIVVCNYQQAAEVMQQKNEEHYRRKCKLERYNKPIIETEVGTLIIYLGFVDGYISPQIEGLEKKFNIVREYKASKKTLGSVIEKFEKYEDCILYCCIVQKDKNDEIHFDHLTNCLREINKRNKKFAKNSEGFDYVALQTYTHKEDSVLMDKIINLARNTLQDITLCIYRE